MTTRAESAFAEMFLLDMSRFDWSSVADRPPRDWTTGEVEKWGIGVRFTAAAARHVAEICPDHAGMFTAFAVTLEGLADMGPTGPAATVDWRLPTSTEKQEPP